MSKKSAAEAVGKTSSTTPVASGKIQFSESQVKKVTDKEFDKYEEVICEAKRNGTFSYDMTGAAG